MTVTGPHTDPDRSNGLMHFTNLQRNSIRGFIYDAQHGARPINNQNNERERRNRRLGKKDGCASLLGTRAGHDSTVCCFRTDSCLK